MTHVELPKEKWFKYHPPIKEETIFYNVDPVVPSSYIEKPPFPVRIKEHAKVSSMVNKSYVRRPKPNEQIKLEPSVAMVKDILVKILMGMLFISVMKQLELKNPMKKINIDLLLACLLSLLK